MWRPSYVHVTGVFYLGDRLSVEQRMWDADLRWWVIWGNALWSWGRGASLADVPESRVVCVTILWTNPRSFSCTKNKYVRVLRFSAYSRCTLFSKKSEAVHTLELGENVMISFTLHFFHREEICPKKKEKVEFLGHILLIEILLGKDI